MATYNTGDTDTPAEIHSELERIEEALGSALCSVDHPCAAVAYYDEGEELPWRIDDDWSSESFATVDDAIIGAREWEAAYKNAD